MNYYEQKIFKLKRLPLRDRIVVEEFGDAFLVDNLHRNNVGNYEFETIDFKSIKINSNSLKEPCMALLQESNCSLVIRLEEIKRERALLRMQARINAKINGQWSSCWEGNIIDTFNTMDESFKIFVKFKNNNDIYAVVSNLNSKTSKYYYGVQKLNDNEITRVNIKTIKDIFIGSEHMLEFFQRQEKTFSKKLEKLEKERRELLTRIKFEPLHYPRGEVNEKLNEVVLNYKSKLVFDDCDDNEEEVTDEEIVQYLRAFMFSDKNSDREFVSSYEIENLFMIDECDIFLLLDKDSVFNWYSSSENPLDYGFSVSFKSLSRSIFHIPNIKKFLIKKLESIDIKSKEIEKVLHDKKKKAIEGKIMMLESDIASLNKELEKEKKELSLLK